MIQRPRKKLRRRPRIYRDIRGLPAKHVDVRKVGRCIDLLLYWARQNGISVVTDAQKPVYVILGEEGNPGMLDHIKTTKAVEAARRRNPGGVFTLAEEVFGTRRLADLWMRTRLIALSDRRPVDLLDTGDGIGEVLAVLYRSGAE